MTLHDSVCTCHLVDCSCTHVHMAYTLYHIQIMHVASICCKGRVVSVLEGGNGLRRSPEATEKDYTQFVASVRRHVDALTGY
jgi:hypothetical protein